MIMNCVTDFNYYEKQFSYDDNSLCNRSYSKSYKGSKVEPWQKLKSAKIQFNFILLISFDSFKCLLLVGNLLVHATSLKFYGCISLVEKLYLQPRRLLN